MFISKIVCKVCKMIPVSLNKVHLLDMKKEELNKY